MTSSVGILRWDARQRQLTISESLLAALGYPHQLIVERVGQDGLVLYQAGDPRISPDAKVRLSIGEDAAARLGLIDGRYDARVEGGAIVAVVWRESESS